MKILYLPFDLAQGGESFDAAQDREHVERLVEPFRISIFGFRIYCAPCSLWFGFLPVVTGYES